MSGKSKTKWAQRPRRASDYITNADRIRLLSETNGKLLAANEGLKADFCLAADRVSFLEQLLVSWVTSKRADARWMTEPEAALFREGMKLVPPREYVALEPKP